MVGAVCAAAYAATLVATLPARFVASRAKLPPEIVDVSGTVWNGRALIAGGYEADWSVAPLRSLLSFALAARWALAGPDTNVAGMAALRPGSLTLADVEGRAGWGLVRVAVPNLAFACDGTAALSIARIVLSQARQGAEGEARSGPAKCLDSSRSPPQTIDVPPLAAVATIDGDRSTVILTTVADPATPLAEIAVLDRVLAVTIQPAGAKLTQSLPTSGPITLEYPF